MRRYLLLALLAASFSANALQSIRVGSQVLVVSDSAARVKAMLGEPSVRAKAFSSSKGKKNHARQASSAKNKGSAKGNGEQWQYEREGRITTFTLVGGKIAHIEDVAR